MKYNVHGRARVEADSPGAAEEIATYENVRWEVMRRGWVRRQGARVTAALGLGWMATAPWADGGVGLVVEHAARAFAPIGALLALVG